MDYDAKQQLVPMGYPLLYNQREVFKVSSAMQSCTKTPEFYKVNGKYLVDCPGMDDSETTLEFPNVDSIHYIMKVAKSV